MYRTAAVILTLAAVFFAVRSAEEPVLALQRPAVPAAPEIFETAGGQVAGEGRAPDRGQLEIGSFEKPERVPDYEVLEENPDSRDGARATRLLVDTRSREEAEFVLIARDLKARYSDYDAVSVEFTDTEEVLFYNGDKVTRDLLTYHGGALIFNTYDGAGYLGYIYGPPNMDGYFVRAAE